MWTHFLLLLSGKYPKGLDIMAINDEPAPRLIDEAWKAVRNRSVLNRGVALGDTMMDNCLEDYTLIALS